ncbi:MAG: hypothetical protein AAGA90_07765 [Actinomycetota bacterium]
MASLTAAVLSDFAQVRDGLMFVSSGGITRVTRTEFPAALGCQVAVLIYVNPGEDPEGMEIAVTITLEEEDEFEATLSTHVAHAVPNQSAPAAPTYIAAVVDLRTLELPMPGTYRVRVSQDDDTREFAFLAVTPPAD